MDIIPAPSKYSQIAEHAIYDRALRNYLTFLLEVQGLSVEKYQPQSKKHWLVRLQKSAKTTGNYCLEHTLNRKPSWFHPDPQLKLIFSPPGQGKNSINLDRWLVVGAEALWQHIERNPESVKVKCLRRQTRATNPEGTEVGLWVIPVADIADLSQSLPAWAIQEAQDNIFAC